MARTILECGGVRWWIHLTASNLEDTLRWKKSRRRFLKRIGTRWMDDVWSYKVLFDTRNLVSCAIWDVCNENMGDSRRNIWRRVSSLDCFQRRCWRKLIHGEIRELASDEDRCDKISWHEQFLNVELWGDRCIDDIKPRRHSTVGKKRDSTIEKD